nr:hypothetical protein [Tanacetum cinerariifolium]
TDASEGFNQIIDFLNGSYIEYALAVNPTIYVSCIKQFWNTVVIKQSNDVTSLVRNVDSSSKFYMYPRFIHLIIQKQLGDLSTYTTKYISPALTQKVFANMRRVGKGCSGVETPLFEGMLVAREPEEHGDEEAQAQPQGADFLMSLLQEALDTCTALTRRVEHLEHDKEAVEVVTTAKLITEYVATVSETVSAAAVVPTVTAAVVPTVTAAVVPTVTAAVIPNKRPQTEAQARRNMTVYLKNTTGFRLDYFKGMSYDDIRPIFEAKFNANMEFLLKTKEQIEEEENKAIKSINETPAQKAAK